MHGTPCIITSSTLISQAAAISHELVITRDFNIHFYDALNANTKQLLSVLDLSNLLNLSLFLIFSVVILWISSLLLPTPHRLLSPLTVCSLPLIILQFSLNNLLNSFHSAYIKIHFAETELLAVHENIIRDICLCHLHLSTAF
jgi:hypothetical protein